MFGQFLHIVVSSLKLDKKIEYTYEEQVARNTEPKKESISQDPLKLLKRYFTSIFQ